MPDYTRYPNATDVEILFKSAAYWPEGTPDSAKVIYAKEEAAIGANAAARAFEELTGYIPFLSTDDAGVTSTIVINPRTFQGSGVLRLNNGLLRLDEVSLNGQNIALNQVVAMPGEAPMLRRPYSYLLFPFYKYWPVANSYQPLQVSVTGRWGYCTLCPEDAWADILQYAAVKTISQVENVQSIASLSQDGLTKAWDIVGILTQKDLAGEQGIWGREFRRTVEEYKRRV
jgi:hypothetical protein